MERASLRGAGGGGAHLLGHAQLTSLRNLMVGVMATPLRTNRFSQFFPRTQTPAQMLTNEVIPKQFSDCQSAGPSMSSWSLGPLPPFQVPNQPSSPLLRLAHKPGHLPPEGWYPPILPLLPHRNSIDAGATVVAVRLHGGGLDRGLSRARGHSTLRSLAQRIGWDQPPAYFPRGTPLPSHRPLDAYKRCDGRLPEADTPPRGSSRVVSGSVFWPRNPLSSWSAVIGRQRLDGGPHLTQGGPGVDRIVVQDNGCGLTDDALEVPTPLISAQSPNPCPPFLPPPSSSKPRRTIPTPLLFLYPPGTNCSPPPPGELSPNFVFTTQTSHFAPSGPSATVCHLACHKFLEEDILTQTHQSSFRC